MLVHYLDCYANVFVYVDILLFLSAYEVQRGIALCKLSD